MPDDAGTAMKARLRADLRGALKEGRSREARVIRALVAALDNAEAPPPAAGPAVRHDFASGSAEAARLTLDAGRVRAAILADIAERDEAAAGLGAAGKADRAAELRAEAAVARRYLD